ncbi:MAG: Inositol 2-dehydrogenase [Planctomycetes bacterium ADurb.Bin126]|nr:MAG: Inositol 2-dehydrogenase [Planctomycetes bacterium ADurb.Bin126]HQL75856.1 Gfo/Idh/MocA family oxidoreductase [Phycisphaerae bacterium]
MNTKDVQSNSRGVSRRAVLAGGAAAAAFTIVPRRVLGGPAQTPPSGKLNIAAVGVGGMGQNNIRACSGENIVALCDVHPDHAKGVFAKYPQAHTYKDYREMFDKEKNIDAVIVATPDHTHAPIAMTAIRMGKHVYVQKPMAHSVSEARALTEAARKHKVITQMGNQGRSGDGVRMVCEWIWDGAIGDIREVHAWTNRPVWPQGVEVERPKETPPVPEGMDWDLWIGPAAMRPYHPTYHPGTWRAWWDFGTGSLGDLGCHILDAPFSALKLKYPVSVEGCISTYWSGLWKPCPPKNETFPRSTIVRYKFPAREGMPEVKLTWWDGGLTPPRPEQLEEGRRMGDEDGGVLFVGDKGLLMCGCYGRSPRLIPDSAMKTYKPPKPSFNRVPGGEGGHEKDWLRACKDGKASSSNFDYSGPLSEMVLMGNLAVRYPDRRLLWDGEKMKVTNCPEADAFVQPKYRQGWTL